MTLLTTHFTLEEYLHSDVAIARGIPNTPSDQNIINMVYHAQMMEDIRQICGNHPVFISSGFRNFQVNAAAGGVANSAHLSGCACDFTIPDFGDPTKICNTLQKHLEELEIDQLIDEGLGGARWVHVGRAVISAKPRHECWTINVHGTSPGFAVV